ncbi:hypothetical protein IJI31_05515 [bacterium]|nr:hypothetical protein [bacterium]
MINYEEAVGFLLSGKIDCCFDFFKEHENFLETAYCYLLEEKLYNAMSFFRKTDNPRGIWGKRISKIFLDEYDEVPTYFQIRNFFEIDMDLFIKLEKYDYANLMLRNIDLFYSVNSESYKLVSRVLLNNGYNDAAKVYLEKSKSKYYNDPELHFLDMQYYEKVGDYDSALKAVANCLDVIPYYYPAMQAKERLLKLKKV